MSDKLDYRLVLSQIDGRSIALQSIDLDDRAAVKIDEVLERAEALDVIRNDEDLEDFRLAQCDIDDCLGSLEASRRILKAPFLAAVKKIDAAAKLFSEALVKQSERLKSAMSEVYGERRRAQLAEQQRLEEMTVTASLAAMEAEDPVTKQQLEQSAVDAMQAANSAVKPENGVRIRLSYEKNLVDWEIVARSNPGLLRVELDKLAVDNLIRNLQNDGVEIQEDSIPGVKLTQRVSLSMRR